MAVGDPFFDEAELKGLGIVIRDSKELVVKLKMLNEEHVGRVGQELIKHFSDKQLDAFEKLIDDEASEDKKFEWLKKNNPNYNDVVNEIFIQLKDELKHGRI